MQDNIVLHAEILLDFAYKEIASVKWNDTMKHSFCVYFKNII